MERRQEGGQLAGDRKDNNRKKEREMKQGTMTNIMKNYIMDDVSQRHSGDRMTDENVKEQEDWRGRKRK